MADVGFNDTSTGYNVVNPFAIGVRGKPVVRSIVVDTGARDGGTAGGASDTKLRAGLVLGLVTATGQYSDYDNDASDGTENEEDCVILAEDVADISTGDQRAHVYAEGGDFNWTHLRWRLAADKSAFEREKANFAFYNTV